MGEGAAFFLRCGEGTVLGQELRPLVSSDRCLKLQYSSREAGYSH